MGLGDPIMDISGLASSSASQSFPGYGGTASLPAITQAKIMVQSQSLGLLPTASGANLGNLSNIYDAVGKQALGALAGLSAIEITKLSMGIGDGQTTAAPGAASTSAAASSLPAGASANPSSFKNPALGATLAQLLKEDGYVAPEANPYVVNNDFFSDQGSLGGLLDSTV